LQNNNKNAILTGKENSSSTGSSNNICQNEFMEIKRRLEKLS